MKSKYYFLMVGAVVSIFAGVGVLGVEGSVVMSLSCEQAVNTATAVHIPMEVAVAITAATKEYLNDATVLL